MRRATAPSAFLNPLHDSIGLVILISFDPIMDGAASYAQTSGNYAHPAALV